MKMIKQLLVLTLVPLWATTTAFSQAYINADNVGLGVNVMVYDPAITSAPVNIGTPAAAAGYVGAGPSQVSFFLYAALNGTALSTLENASSLVDTGPNVSGVISSIQGSESLGNPVYLPGFDGTEPLEFIAFGITAGGDYSGWSAEATDLIPGRGTVFPTTIFGTTPGLINSFLLTGTSALPPVVPEPASFAIAGIGAVALALFRRRK